MTPPPDRPAVRPSRDTRGIAWLREYVSPEHWKPLGPSDDYQIFGDMRLSDLRAVLAEYDAALASLADDAARWQFFRRYLSVEDDIGYGGQYLLVDDGLPHACAKGFEHTVESLVDVARSPIGETPAESQPEYWAAQLRECARELDRLSAALTSVRERVHAVARSVAQVGETPEDPT